LELSSIMNKIKGYEADSLAGVDTKNRVNFVEEGLTKREYLCRLCNKKHAKFKCSVQCSTCKRKGSHLTADCFHKDKSDVDSEKSKRDRSQGRGDKRRQRKRGGELPSQTKAEPGALALSQSQKLRTELQR
jgi:hypothetical protein